MKLNYKLGATVALFIATSTLLSLYLIFSFSRIVNLKDYQVRTSNTIVSWYALRIHISDLITLRTDTEVLLDDWLNYKESFTAALDDLANDPMRARLSEDTVQQLAGATNLYKLIDQSFSSLETEIVALAGTELAPITRYLLKNNGLISVYLNNQTLDDYPMISTFYLRLTNAIYKLNVYSGSFGVSMEEFRAALDSEVRRIMTTLLLSSFILLALVSVLTFIIVTRITSRIVHRLASIRTASELLAARDLTINLSDSTPDELGELATHLNHTITLLGEFMSVVKTTATEATDISESVNQSSGEVTSATTQITANINSMEDQFKRLNDSVQSSIDALNSMSDFLVTFLDDIDTQSQTIKESTHAITSMSSSIDTISRISGEKADETRELKRIASEGEEKISEAETLLVSVTEKLDEVHSFIALINSIAEQTSILSMNAAIESAHAGEAGKGFAVVADEIQKLAESTTENSYLINTTLSDIISQVQEAQRSSHNATRAFSATVRMIEELVEALGNIVSELAAIDQMGSDLAQRSDQVSRSTDDLSDKTARLEELRDTVTTQIGIMESIFSEARGGIAEIGLGTTDILHRITSINSLSRDNREKMSALHAMLDGFKTEGSV